MSPNVECQRFVARVAEHLRKGVVGVEQAPVDADEDHADGGVFHDFAEQRPALVEAEHLPLLRLWRAGFHLPSMGVRR